MLTSVAFFLFGIAVGALSGLLGIGGGVVLVPGLMLLFGFTQPAAQGTSLAVLSLPIAVFAAAVYYRHGHVHLPVVGLIAAGFVVGAFTGANFVTKVPVATLRFCFAGLLFYIAFTLAFDDRTTRSKAALPAFVAAVAALLFTRFLRDKLKPHPHVDPPDVHTEYHI